MKKIPDLSVVVLCYRSEEHIVPYVDGISDALRAARINFELVLVANYDPYGLPDKTPGIVRQLSRENTRYRPVIMPKQGMMGWDLRTGLEAAHGRLIALLDGDGQTPPDDIVRLYRLYGEGKYDLCKIFRTRREETLFRKFSSWLFNLLFSLFFPVAGTRDINGKPKLMTRETYQKMRLGSNDWFADAEIMLEARRLGLTIKEIPGISFPNRWRRSFLGPGAVFEFLKNLVVYRWRYWRAK